jgi:DEAD/DEAH box helicase domain-containing protein
MAVELAAWAGILEGEELAHVGTEPAGEARTAPFPDALHPKLRAALEAQGVTELYEHQRAAWGCSCPGRTRRRRHRHGEREVARLQPARARRARPRAEARALYLYPTKALAQDQLRSLTELKVPRIRPAIYDGDTRPSAAGRSASGRTSSSRTRTCSTSASSPSRPLGRRALEPRLRRDRRGARLPRRLRLARRQRPPRLRRIARIYGAEPQFLLASATIANPAGSRTRCSASTSRGRRRRRAAAERTIALWNPPLLDEELGLRRARSARRRG